MSRRITRAIALLLIACLLADPITASASAFETFPAPHLYTPSTRLRASCFDQQALTERLVGGFEYLRLKTPAIRIRQLAAHAYFNYSGLLTHSIIAPATILALIVLWADPGSAGWVTLSMAPPLSKADAIAAVEKAIQLAEKDKNPVSKLMLPILRASLATLRDKQPASEPPPVPPQTPEVTKKPEKLDTVKSPADKSKQGFQKKHKRQGLRYLISPERYNEIALRIQPLERFSEWTEVQYSLVLTKQGFPTDPTEIRGFFEERAWLQEQGEDPVHIPLKSHVSSTPSSLGSPPSTDLQIHSEGTALQPAGRIRSDERVLWLLNVDTILLLRFGMDARVVRLLTAARGGQKFATLEEARSRLIDTLRQNPDRIPEASADGSLSQLRAGSVRFEFHDTPQEVIDDATGWMIQADVDTLADWIDQASEQAYDLATVNMIARRIAALLETETLCDLGQLIKIPGLGAKYLVPLAEQLYQRVIKERQKLKKKRLYPVKPVRERAEPLESEDIAPKLDPSTPASEASPSSPVDETVSPMSPTAAGSLPVPDVTEDKDEIAAREAVALQNIDPLWRASGASFVWIDSLNDKIERAIITRKLDSVFGEDVPATPQGTKNEQKVLWILVHQLPGVRAVRAYAPKAVFEMLEGSVGRLKESTAFQLTRKGVTAEDWVSVEATLPQILDFDLTGEESDPDVSLREGTYTLIPIKDEPPPPPSTHGGSRSRAAIQEAARAARSALQSAIPRGLRQFASRVYVKYIGLLAHPILAPAMIMVLILLWADPGNASWVTLSMAPPLSTADSIAAVEKAIKLAEKDKNPVSNLLLPILRASLATLQGKQSASEKPRVQPPVAVAVKKPVIRETLKSPAPKPSEAVRDQKVQKPAVNFADYVTLGQLLRAYRERAQLSRKDIALRIHRSLALIGFWETNFQGLHPNRDQTIQLGEWLGFDGAEAYAHYYPAPSTESAVPTPKVPSKIKPAVAQISPKEPASGPVSENVEPAVVASAVKTMTAEIIPEVVIPAVEAALNIPAAPVFAEPVDVSVTKPVPPTVPARLSEPITDFGIVGIRPEFNTLLQRKLLGSEIFLKRWLKQADDYWNDPRVVRQIHNALSGEKTLFKYSYPWLNQLPPGLPIHFRLIERMMARLVKDGDMHDFGAASAKAHLPVIVDALESLRKEVAGLRVWWRGEGPLPDLSTSDLANLDLLWSGLEDNNLAPTLTSVSESVLSTPASVRVLPTVEQSGPRLVKSRDHRLLAAALLKLIYELLDAGEVPSVDRLTSKLREDREQVQIQIHENLQLRHAYREARDYLITLSGLPFRPQALKGLESAHRIDRPLLMAIYDLVDAHTIPTYARLARRIGEKNLELVKARIDKNPMLRRVYLAGRHAARAPRVAPAGLSEQETDELIVKSIQQRRQENHLIFVPGIAYDTGLEPALIQSRLKANAALARDFQSARELQVDSQPPEPTRAPEVAVQRAVKDDVADLVRQASTHVTDLIKSTRYTDAELYIRDHVLPKVPEDHPHFIGVLHLQSQLARLQRRLDDATRLAQRADKKIMILRASMDLHPDPETAHYLNDQERNILSDLALSLWDNGDLPSALDVLSVEGGRRIKAVFAEDRPAHHYLVSLLLELQRPRDARAILSEDGGQTLRPLFREEEHFAKLLALVNRRMAEHMARSAPPPVPGGVVPKPEEYAAIEKSVWEAIYLFVDQGQSPTIPELAAKSNVPDSVVVERIARNPRLTSLYAQAKAPLLSARHETPDTSNLDALMRIDQTLYSIIHQRASAGLLTYMNALSHESGFAPELIRFRIAKNPKITMDYWSAREFPADRTTFVSAHRIAPPLVIVKMADRKVKPAAPERATPPLLASGVGLVERAPLLEGSSLIREFKTYQTIGLFLRACREKAGLTQKDIAVRVQRTNGIISFWEKGYRNSHPNRDQTIVLGKWLGFDGAEVYDHFYPESFRKPVARVSVASAPKQPAQGVRVQPPSPPVATPRVDPHPMDPDVSPPADLPDLQGAYFSFSPDDVRIAREQQAFIQGHFERMADGVEKLIRLAESGTPFIDAQIEYLLYFKDRCKTVHLDDLLAVRSENDHPYLKGHINLFSGVDRNIQGLILAPLGSLIKDAQSHQAANSLRMMQVRADLEISRKEIEQARVLFKKIADGELNPTREASGRKVQGGTWLWMFNAINVYRNWRGLELMSYETYALRWAWWLENAISYALAMGILATGVYTGVLPHSVLQSIPIINTIAWSLFVVLHGRRLIPATLIAAPMIAMGFFNLQTFVLVPLLALSGFTLHRLANWSVSLRNRDKNAPTAGLGSEPPIVRPFQRESLAAA